MTPSLQWHQVGIVDEGGRLQCVTGTLAAERLNLADTPFPFGPLQASAGSWSYDPLNLRETGGASPYSLVADLLPPRGVKALQSDNIRELARKEKPKLMWCGGVPVSSPT